MMFAFGCKSGFVAVLLLGTAAAAEPPALAAAPAARIAVYDEEVGTSLRYVGYNQGHHVPGSNVKDWIRYSGVNAYRFWASVDVYVTGDDHDPGEDVESFNDFRERRSALREDPEGDGYLDWDSIRERFASLTYPGSNRYVLNPLLDDLMELGVTPIAQIHSTRWGDTWREHWRVWQRYYAVAYHLADYAGVELFMMLNEPDHPHSGDFSVEEYLSYLRVASDAIRAAVVDVNARRNRNLAAKVIAPVTAGLPTREWGRKPLESLRTGLEGRELDHNLFDIFSNHRYGPTWERYADEVDQMKEMMRTHAPGGEVLPIVYTEWGRYTTRRWHEIDSTLDTPYVARDIAGIFGAVMERGVLGMVTFKFNNTSREPYVDGMKSGHHFVLEEGNWDITGARRTAEVIRLFATGFSNERLLLRTEVSGGAAGTLKAWTARDPESNDYYLWTVNLGDEDAVDSEIDLSALPLPSGAWATVEAVNSEAFGEITGMQELYGSKVLPLTLPARGVARVAIQSKGTTGAETLAVEQVASVSPAEPQRQRRGSADHLVRRSPSDPDLEAAIFARFELPHTGGVRRAVLRAPGQWADGERPAVIQIHAVQGLPWEKGGPAPAAVRRLVVDPGYLGGGDGALPAGHITLGREHDEGSPAVDVTRVVRDFGGGDVTFVLIAPLRQPEDKEGASFEIEFSADDLILEWIPEEP